MSEYHASGGTFDINQTTNGSWTVVLEPDFHHVSIGTGKHVGTFESKEEAERFCNHWELNNHL